MLENIINGGFMMVPLMVCSVLALAVILDRAWVFSRNSRLDVRALRSQTQRLLLEGRLDDAITLCKGTPGPVSAVLLVGLETYRKLKAGGEPSETVRQMTETSMKDYRSHAMSAVETRFSVLSSIGNSAPLFGMAGTVTGMIKSFAALASAGANLDANLVAAGISEALVTTAAGLLIALAAVIPYNVFCTKADRIGLEVEETIAQFTEFIVMRLEKRKDA